MTQDEIIEMAKQAGYFLYDLTETHQKKTVETDEADEWAQLERFAKLVAQNEREACAIVCDDINAKYKWPDDVAERVASQWCADSIRARK